jgi:hypothetical protein
MTGVATGSATQRCFGHSDSTLEPSARSRQHSRFRPGRASVWSGWWRSRRPSWTKSRTLGARIPLVAARCSRFVLSGHLACLDRHRCSHARKQRREPVCTRPLLFVHSSSEIAVAPRFRNRWPSDARPPGPRDRSRCEVHTSRGAAGRGGRAPSAARALPSSHGAPPALAPGMLEFRAFRATRRHRCNAPKP